MFDCDPPSPDCCSLQVLVPADKLSAYEVERANVLGWCIEWLQACFLVADDVMDASVTRRGQPCWYKLDGVAMIAVNDAFLLRSALFVFLKKYFSGEAYYVRLIEMFNEVRSVGWRGGGGVGPELSSPRGLVHHTSCGCTGPVPVLLLCVCPLTRSSQLCRV